MPCLNLNQTSKCSISLPQRAGRQSWSWCWLLPRWFTDRQSPIQAVTTWVNDLTIAGPTCSLSLSFPVRGGRVTAPIRSRKSRRLWGSTLNFPPGQTSLLTWSWAGHCSTRCSAVSSALLQCGQVAESRHPIQCRYSASNGEWSVRSWATVMHWSLTQSRCKRWNWLTLPANSKITIPKLNH